MTDRQPYIKAGPVYVDGVLAFTATRDLFIGDICVAGDIMRPDGTIPEAGEPMTDAENRVMQHMVEFTQ